MALEKPVLKLYTGHKAQTDTLMTPDELCEFLGIKRSRLYSMTHRKQIPHLKIYGQLRFRRSVIDAWLKEQEVRCASEEVAKQRRNGLEGRRKRW